MQGQNAVGSANPARDCLWKERDAARIDEDSSRRPSGGSYRAQMLSHRLLPWAYRGRAADRRRIRPPSGCLRAVRASTPPRRWVTSRPTVAADSQHPIIGSRHGCVVLGEAWPSGSGRPVATVTSCGHRRLPRSLGRVRPGCAVMRPQPKRVPGSGPIRLPPAMCDRARSLVAYMLPAGVVSGRKRICRTPLVGRKINSNQDTGAAPVTLRRRIRPLVRVCNS